MSKNKSVFLIFSLLTLFACLPKNDADKYDKPNILFIAVDDLRPELEVYGNPIIKTPHMDQLAGEGYLFTRHYVQVPTCGASRYSLMTGLRPSKAIHLKNQVFYEEMAPAPESQKPESFVHHLKRNGYTTVGIGKLSHSVDGLVYGYNEIPSDVKEMPHSWDRFVFDPGIWKTGWNAFFAYANGENRQSLKNLAKPYEIGEVDDDGYPDGLILRSAMAELEKLKKNNQTFFLGVGFFKPHLPFNAPKKYWDRYQRENIPLPKDPFLPKNINSKSLGSMGEFYNYKLSDEKPTYQKPVSDTYAQKLIHGYYAAVSYTDHLIGKLLSKLKSLELDQNTIVVLWGDHGWHLGNDRKWGKHTLFETALKSVLMIKIPGKKNTSYPINTIVESVDIYPTLMELCGIAPPYPLDGKSLVELLDNPSTQKNQRAYSYWNQGFSMRTDRYRITRHFWEGKHNIELYDHFKDPQENVNIASDKPKIVDSLLPILMKGDPGFYTNKSENKS